MTVEQWLREQVKKNHLPSKSHGGIFVPLFFIIILAASLFRRTSPQEWVLIWQNSASEDRWTALVLVVTTIAIFFSIKWLLSFLPLSLTSRQSGWQGQLTGRQIRSLHREQDRLVEKLREIYKSVSRPPIFTDKDYQIADEKLRNFRALRMTELNTLATEPWLKILVLSGAIGAKHGSIVRSVNARSIEESLI